MEFTKPAEACPHCFDVTKMRVPTLSDKVYKDECHYCFNTNHHGEGIFISMNNFVGVCKSHLKKLQDMNPGAPMMLICKEKEMPKREITDVKDLGVEPPKEYDYRLVCTECKLEFDLAAGEVGATAKSIEGIKNAISPKIQDEIQKNEWMNAIDCPHALELKQEKLPGSDGTAPTSSSKCAMCDHTENNWMCLTCGSIGCPREEAGGQGHGILHSLMTGHPLVVKLGTITPAGADIHCYHCNDEVRDAKLREHLAFHGIDMMTSVKTSKTLGEMMYDNSMKHDYSAITEDNAKLVPVYGSGLTGLHNFGNTCYMASVLQLLMSIPAFKKRYYDQYMEKAHQDACPTNPLVCYECQMEKLGRGMFSGEFADESKKDIQGANGITPRDFKKFITDGHRDFSTGDQQDAQEFLVYCLQQLSRKELAVGSTADPTKVVEYVTQSKTQCGACKATKYQHQLQNVLSLNIPIPPPTPAEIEKRNTMSKEEIEATRPHCDLEKILEEHLKANTFECRCSECNEPAMYSETTLMDSFPDHLFLHVRREYLCHQTYQTKKLDVFVDVPDELDIEKLKAPKRPEGEKLFTKAAPAAKKTESKIEVDEVALVQLISMGIEMDAAKWALQNTSNNVERAVDFVFSHPEGPPPAEEPAAPEPSAPPVEEPQVTASTNGAPHYELTAMISHVGSSALTGHYVAHLKKNGQWHIFNDEKVALSSNPPKRMASIYLYTRKQ